MKPQDFVRELSRMCGSYKHRRMDNECVGCPMEEKDCWLGVILGVNRPEKFAEAYDIVAEWSDAHPRETRQSEFLKLFPNARVMDGAISLCPKFYCLNFLGTDLPTCNAANCAKCMHEYWLAPIDESEDTKCD